MVSLLVFEFIDPQPFFRSKVNSRHPHHLKPLMTHGNCRRSLELRPALPMAIPSARARAARAARAPCAQPRSRDLPRRRLQGPKVARSIPSVGRPGKTMKHSLDWFFPGKSTGNHSFYMFLPFNMGVSCTFSRKPI